MIICKIFQAISVKAYSHISKTYSHISKGTILISAKPYPTQFYKIIKFVNFVFLRPST